MRMNQDRNHRICERAVKSSMVPDRYDAGVGKVGNAIREAKVLIESYT